MPFVETFGGQNIFPSDLSFLSLVMTTNVTLQWPVEQAVAGQDVFADIMEITPNAGLNLIFPDARNTAPGQACLVNNIGANTLTVKDNTGATIGSVPSGQVWQFYLDDNTTQAGGWRTFQFGTGASSATAAALAGAGLKAIATTLNVKALPRSTGSPMTIVDSDRAAIVQYTGGAGTGTLPTPASLGTDWFTYLRNSGSGTVVITPAAGLINGAATLSLSPFSSTMLFTDGANFFTIGLSQVTPTNFDFTSINVAGGAGTTILAGTQLNRIAYKFTGVLTGNRIIEVPGTVQQYWVNNATTGAFTLTVKTNAGAGVVVPQGYSMLLYCDGTDVVAAEGSPTAGLLPVDLGGTGIFTYAQGDILYASAANVLAKLAKSVTATRYLANTGAANAPAWDQINLANGITGRLPFANLTQAAGFSVLGNFSNVVADMAPIVGAADQVLRVDNTGTSLAFGLINLAASVFNTLGATNGGTGQGTTVLGDTLYADAANSWARLAKDATGIKVLSNQGAGNIPAWIYQRFGVTAAANANTTFALTDRWSWIPHTEATTTRTYTVPTNAAVPIEVGGMVGVDNRAGSGALTMSAASGVTVDGRGASVTGAPTTFFTLPPGYKMVLVKVATDTWIFYSDAPQAGGVGTDYAGWVQAAAASQKMNTAAAGWTSSNPATGQITVTHNLGLSSANDMVVTASFMGTGGDDRTIILQLGTNSFNIFTADVGSGAVDVDVNFRALRIA